MRWGAECVAVCNPIWQQALLGTLCCNRTARLRRQTTSILAAGHLYQFQHKRIFLMEFRGPFVRNYLGAGTFTFLVGCASPPIDFSSGAVLGVGDGLRTFGYIGKIYVVVLNLKKPRLL